MILFWRLLCGGYALILSYMLLSPNPLADMPRPDVERGPHTLLFLPLAALALAARPPLKTWMVIGLLASYAAATELLQALVPNRHTDPLDLLENLLGIALGAAVVWGAGQIARRLAASPAEQGAELERVESRRG